MVKAMKKNTLTKGTSTGSSKDRKPLKKGNPDKKPSTKGMPGKKPLNKGLGILKASTLKRLGKMSLAQKMQKIAEDASTPEEGALMLKDSVSKLENSKIWCKHQTYLKNNPDEKEKFDQLSKKEKGHQAALWCLQQNVPKFMHMSESLEQSATLDKRERWETEMEMLTRFSSQELECHLESGRVVWRYDPWTPSCVQYQDMQDVTKTTSVKRSRNMTEGQELEQNEETEDQWQAYKSKDFNAHMLEIHGWGAKGKSLTKGAGKGKSLSKGKGKGVKKGGPLPIEDGDPDPEEEKTPEQEWQSCLGKVKRARDASNSALSDLEQAMQKCSLAKRLTKTTKQDAEKISKQLQQQIAQLKSVLLKKEHSMSLDKVKALLLSSAKKIKEVKEEAKDFLQLANKATSRASKS